jgi:hypothetical protein
MLQELKSAAKGSVLETHPHYRTAIGVLGVLLPILLIVSSLVQQQQIRNSISAYYHTSARDWFVGTLWVLGVFLFFYRYRPLNVSAPRSQSESIRTGAADAWLGKIAGVSAVLVALLPTTDEGSPAQPAIIGTAHGVSAAILFICLSLFPLLLFSQSRNDRPDAAGSGACVRAGEHSALARPIEARAGSRSTSDLGVRHFLVRKGQGARGR